MVRCLNAASCLLLLVPAVHSSTGQGCHDALTCQARFTSLSARLESTHDEMRGRQLTLHALGDLRRGILTGERIEMPSAQRQHLEKGTAFINDVSFDARHRPVSTNTSRHFQSLRVLAADVEVRFHAVMPLKRGSSTQKSGPSALLVVIDDNSLLSIFSLDGESLLEKLDLGHGVGRKVTQLALSPSQDNHFVVTADDHGDVRVHNLKVVARKEKNENEPASGPDKTHLLVTANFSCTFSLPANADGEARKLNVVLPMDRGTSTFFVTGDSLGGIAVFHRNGTLKGRVRVTDDPGGVRGLLRSQAQMVLFYSSHSFGFFSVTQIDVQYPPCTGWNSPLYDVILDPSYSSSRVVLALSDGDVIVFSTTRGKNKACDLTLKFPHLSMHPFKLNAVRGHVLGLPTPLDGVDSKDDHMRELYFFNIGAMETGYGVAPSRSVSVQASFEPKKPESVSVFSGAGAGLPAGDRTKSEIAIKFSGLRGVELFELSLKQPAAPKAANSQGSGSWTAGLTSWFSSGR